MAYLSETIGEFGLYQLWLSFWILCSKFGIGLNHMAFLFLAPQVKYTCEQNETCCDNPVYDKSIFQRTIITEWNLICNRAWMKDFNQTAFQFGVLIGSFLAGVASDRFGRRPIIILSVMIEIFSGVLAAFVPDFWTFTILRLILGIAVAGVMVVGFVILMEYIGFNYRDTMSAVYHTPFTMGQMILAFLAYFIRDYIYLQLTISLLNVFLVGYICFMPESPRWLLAKNKTSEAIELIVNIAKRNKRPTEGIEEKIIEFQNRHHIHEKKKGTFIDLFRTPNIRKNMLIMAFNWLACSYCFYGVAQYVTHLTDDLFINVALSGAVCFCSTVLAIPALNLIGRKTLVIVSNFLCGVCLLIIAVIPQGLASMILGCIGVFFSFIVFVVVYVYCTELFPTVVRNAAIGISSMMARIGAMIAPFVASLNRNGRWCAPVAFGVVPIIAAGLSFLLPETKDCELMVTIEEGEAFGKKNPTTNATSTNATTINATSTK